MQEVITVEFHFQGLDLIAFCSLPLSGGYPQDIKIDALRLTDGTRLNSWWLDLVIDFSDLLLEIQEKAWAKRTRTYRPRPCNLGQTGEK